MTVEDCKLLIDRCPKSFRLSEVSKSLNKILVSELLNGHKKGFYKDSKDSPAYSEKRCLGYQGFPTRHFFGI